MFQSSNTRSQKGEKEKNPPPPSSDAETVDDPTDNDTSVMDRTRRLRQARAQAKEKARIQQAAEVDAAQLDSLIADIQQRVEVTRAAKLRSAESHRVLDQLQAELAEEQERSEEDEVPDPDPIPSSQNDIGSLVNSIKSVVRYIIVIYYFAVSLCLYTTNKPLEGIDSFDVLLDKNESVDIRYPKNPGFQHLFLFFYFIFLCDSCSRSTCRHLDPFKVLGWVTC